MASITSIPTSWATTLTWRATAWTYRKVDETDPHPAGYAPLGVEGGIAKEKAKMTLLWQELEKRNIPLTVVVYPYPAQLVHDSAESRQVRLWRRVVRGQVQSTSSRCFRRSLR